MATNRWFLAAMGALIGRYVTAVGALVALANGGYALATLAILLALVFVVVYTVCVRRDIRALADEDIYFGGLSSWYVASGLFEPLIIAYVAHRTVVVAEGSGEASQSEEIELSESGSDDRTPSPTEPSDEPDPATAWTDMRGSQALTGIELTESRPIDPSSPWFNRALALVVVYLPLAYVVDSTFEPVGEFTTPELLVPWLPLAPIAIWLIGKEITELERQGIDMTRARYGIYFLVCIPMSLVALWVMRAMFFRWVRTDPAVPADARGTPDWSAPSAEPTQADGTADWSVPSREPTRSRRSVATSGEESTGSRDPSGQDAAGQSSNRDSTDDGDREHDDRWGADPEHWKTND